MSTQTYVVQISNQDIVMRVAETSFGQMKIMGGVPGPQGPPGVDTADAIQTHVDDPTPHPVYDDQPSLSLIYENGLI